MLYFAGYMMLLLYILILQSVLLDFVIMGKKIDEKTLAAAKEKLACKIEPTTYASGAAAGGFSQAANTGTPGQQITADSFIGPNGEVLLTHMTTAGG